MQAAIIHAPGQMDIETWEKPLPGAGEALLAVGAAGLCAGDMYFYLGKNPYAHYPQICGHEIAGTVVEVGSDVGDTLVGMRVAVEPFISCGKCYPCRIGKANCCTNLQIIGVHKPGGFAEYVVAPAALIHPIPDGLSLVEASFAEPVAIALQTLRRGEVGAEDILIMGCGPIGLALIEVAQARGARVFVTDHHPSRLEIAARLGAAILPSDDKLPEAVLAQTKGEGMPVVIEATGSSGAIEMTPHLVAAGGRIVIVSLLNQGMMVSLPGFELIRKEMTILGSRASYQCFPEALQLLADHTIRYTESASTFALRNAPEVFNALAADKSRVQKAVFVME
jgi:2-desacetyl-2-hydroxyethyl bacteriochlorophyllide A dehydrogenase